MFGIVQPETFLLAGILLNLTPGSDTVYILSRSIAQGRWAGLYSALGISAGCLVHTMLAAFGLSVILAQSALAFALVKMAGAVYLGYLGLKTLLTKKSGFTLATPTAASVKTLFLQGLLTNVLNPKVALFFLSFLPQFIDPANAYGMIPFLLLGAIFLTTGTLWSLALVWFSSRLTTHLRDNGQYGQIMNKVCGMVYLVMGAKLLTAER